MTLINVLINLSLSGSWVQGWFQTIVQWPKTNESVAVQQKFLSSLFHRFTE